MSYFKTAWSYLVGTKNWLKSKQITVTPVTGWHIVVFATVVGVLMIAAYWNGRLSHREVGRMLGFAMPAADLLPSEAQLKLDQCASVAWSWKDRAEKAEAELALTRGDASTLKTAANLPKPECKPQVKWKTFCPKPTTLLQDWGVVK